MAKCEDCFKETDLLVDCFRCKKMLCARCFLSATHETCPKIVGEKGCRVYANEKGELILAEGDYGLHPVSGWQCRPFGHHAGGIGKHNVTEHEDGTITVSPSILLTDFDERGNQIQWHGFLEHGIWREV